MSQATQQKLRTKDVKIIHDLCRQHHLDLGMTTDLAFAQSDADLRTYLADVNDTDMLQKLAAILRSHEAAIENGKSQRADRKDVTPAIAAILKTLTGAEFGAPRPSAPAAAKDQDMGDSNLPALLLNEGSADICDPILDNATDGRITSLKTLVEIYNAALATAVEMTDMIAGAAENDVTSMPSYRAANLHDVIVSKTMAPAIDRLLSSALTPAMSLQDILDGIAHNERAITSATLEIREIIKRQRHEKLAGKASEPSAMPGDIVQYFDKASALFPQAYGAAVNVLDFDVPVLKHAVPNPHVPHVDNSFRFNARVLMEALHAITENEIIWLYGESGCGKTAFWEQVAAHLGMPFTRLNMDSALTRADVLGSLRFVRHADGRQEMHFIEGLLPRAMQMGGLLLIDELDLGDPEIMPVLQPVLEGNPLVLLEDGGRVVVPHPSFRIAITGNTKGLGSENQMYLNAHEQSAATRDRVSAFVEMPYLPPAMEEEVVMARYPQSDKAFVSKLIQLANKVRNGYRQGDIYSLFSTRAVQYCVARHNRFAPLYANQEEAALDVLETVIINRLDPSSTKTVKEMIDNIFVTA